MRSWIWIWEIELCVVNRDNFWTESNGCSDKAANITWLSHGARDRGHMIKESWKHIDERMLENLFGIAQIEPPTLLFPFIIVRFSTRGLSSEVHLIPMPELLENYWQIEFQPTESDSRWPNCHEHHIHHNVWIVWWTAHSEIPFHNCQIPNHFMTISIKSNFNVYHPVKCLQWSSRLRLSHAKFPHYQMKHFHGQFLNHQKSYPRLSESESLNF
jgi:hypothetical protein